MPFKFRGINKNEGRFIIVALLLIGIFSYFNFQQSYIRARDVARKNDLKHIAAALNNYFYDFNQYPPSRNGRILVCGNPEYPTECKWGLDGIKDLSDPSYPAYINSLPRDPQSSSRDYVYISDTRNYQLFASLESDRDAEYNGKVAIRKINCAKHICNFGISSMSKVEENLAPATSSAQPVYVKR
ncbi:MAG: hypothetical protein A2782_01665 [Candidatus Blackburnbacteria bacterium RIFCSPHIGHO2_01_FULL_43_15b]|uniref:Type II secretion system protein GspG C-terminal domain-containing protein n=1 Tax=Candidatus Blackburnbacteria bacterium RIFCSPHIGHO2_01_FULL_43_15b TaxID=1797513 RepID=A0A1G1UXK6_9BACT|nr:MAG: hypothetical protein A2782_01665 [Candidatus Blackburnbacteria bacterium RIFCSPHIGHO2_01_FULL_43_15b]